MGLLKKIAEDSFNVTNVPRVESAQASTRRSGNVKKKGKSTKAGTKKGRNPSENSLEKERERERQLQEFMTAGRLSPKIRILLHFFFNILI